jgi:hypothetical protein
VFYRGKIFEPSPLLLAQVHQFHVARFSDLRESINVWCDESFGPNQRNGGTRWTNIGASWLIYGDDDALAFRLRWC